MIKKGAAFCLLLTLSIHFRVALSYDNPLMVEKACGLGLLHLSDGCVYGVERLPDIHRQRFFAHQSGISTITTQTVGVDGKLSQLSQASGLFPNSSDVDEVSHDLINSPRGPYARSSWVGSMAGDASVNNMKSANTGALNSRY
jgi:hypothetical protein